ncbi:MAG: Na/Pi symporter [Bacteroidetes bacterium]|nr:Na/Pi symporter [Bacteroidota bacterium]MBU1115427.1 Na/Pi symporter [Bacteroidota bacterium]MBU1797570.1 Na/Pi symporter [Bacteroidota bacterium]
MAKTRKLSYYLSLFIFISSNIFAQIQDSVLTRIDSTHKTIKIIDDHNSNTKETETIYSTANSLVEKPLTVLILDFEDRPIEGVPVYFSIIYAPQKSVGTQIENDTVFTNQNGIAQTSIKLGSEKGDYDFSARIDNNNGENNIVYFKIYARDQSWVFYLVIGLIGGLALFILGMEMMSDGLKKAAGSKMRSILSTITNNRFIAVIAGIFVTIGMQSSSATTVMLVSFVQAQLMTFSQSLGIILGASIGTTITAQLIAFKITDYALLIVGIGVLIRLLAKTKKLKNIGGGILGFGILFLGMWLMSDSMFPLRTYKPFIDLLLHLENPIMGILVGTLFTALIQSSGAFIGIVIVLGSQGLITLEAAIPLLLGSNLGTSITAILASINSSRDAKRVALAHSLFKILGIILFAWWIPTFADLIRTFSPATGLDITSPNNFDALPRQIANAHTFFNIILTAILLPGINIAAKLITKMLPDIPDEEEEEHFKTKYLEDDLISTPALALSLTKAEIIRMALKVKGMIEKILPIFFDYKPEALDELNEKEEEIDFLNFKINRYLRKISQESIVEERSDEIFQLMHTATEIEQIGNVIAKRLVPLAKKKNKNNIHFSEEGEKEIREYHLKTIKQMSRSIEYFKDINLQDAKHIKQKYKKYRLMEQELRRTHFDRLLDEVPETVESSQIHLELIELLKRISSHATNIASMQLESHGEKEKEISLKAELHNIEKKKKKKKEIEE